MARSDEPGILWSEPLYEFSKLVVAAIVGMLVTLVHRRYRHERDVNPRLDQAQVLLCVAGALMMIIINGNLARAFGIAGAASIIRFRTPIEDARDITVLFILMGLGMAAGLGGFALAGLGTLFLCAMLPLLQLFSSHRPRMMLVEITASSRDVPVRSRAADVRHQPGDVRAARGVAGRRSDRRIPDDPSPGSRPLKI